MTDRPTIQIVLTKEQQAQIRQATGKPVAELRLMLERLEERLAPGKMMN